jgi:ABC-type antimicrobial peptide transport system ATPase subunit
MAKQSLIAKAIAKVDEEIAALAAVRLRLEDIAGQGPKAERKPRKAKAKRTETVGGEER